MSAMLYPLLSVANSIDDNTDSTQYEDFTDEQWAAFMAISTKVTSAVCDFALPDDWYQLRTWIDHSSEKAFQRVQKLTVVLCQINLWVVFLLFKFPALSLYRLCDGSLEDHDTKFREFVTVLWEGIGETPTITDMELDLPGFTYIPELDSISELRRLSCRQLSINYPWWKALSCCRRLRELQLEETSRSGGERWEGEFEEVTFPALRSLLLDVREEIAPTILSRSRFPVLDHLSFGSRNLSVDGMERAGIPLKEWSPNLRF
ncbi:hypothetical protein FRC04_008736 [Tulasnella sp. 424]|nr:hypothetical protein FRC04_008736 [Tulasnella sp. 424]